MNLLADDTDSSQVAARSNDSRLVSTLLDLKADVNATNDFGE